MNPLLIAKQGFGGGVLAVALMGFVQAPAVVVPEPPATSYTGGAGGSFSRFIVEKNRYEIPLALAHDEDEEEIIIAILMELAQHVLL